MIILIAESISQIGGTEVYINNTYSALVKTSKEVKVLYTHGESIKPDYIKLPSWNHLKNYINIDDTVICFPDWSAHLYRALNSCSFKSLYITTQCGFYSMFRELTTVTSNVTRAFEELKPRINAMLCIYDQDVHAYESVGVNAIYFPLGTMKSPKPYRKERLTRAVAVASNWDRPFKNSKEADILIDIAKDIGYEVHKYGLGNNSEGLASHDDIYTPNTLMIMPSWGDARPNQILEAAQYNNPVLCRTKWIPEVKNQFVYNSIPEATTILRKLYNRKTKRYCSSKFDIQKSIKLLLNIIDTNPKPRNYAINVSTDAGKAYYSNLTMHDTLESHNTEVLYRNSFVHIDRPLAQVLFDGKLTDEERLLYGQLVFFRNKYQELDSEYIVFCDNSLLKYNIIMGKLKSLNHASIITDKDNKFIAIQSHLLNKYELTSEINNWIEYANNYLQHLDAKYYRRLEIE